MNRASALLIAVPALVTLLGACTPHAARSPAAAPPPVAPSDARNTQIALPPPAQLYRDADPPAIATQSADPLDARAASRAQYQLDRHPRDARRIADVGYWAAQRGDRATAIAYFDRALNAAMEPADRRHVLWSYGWALFSLDDNAGAILQWDRARREHGGAPFWFPYTVALALWRQGDHALAVDYFDAAVRSDPSWGNEAQMRARTQRWKPKERAAIDSLFAASRARATP